jgi:hypothetical protein
MAVAVMPGLISCTSAEVAPVAASALAKPNVIMAADPPPPFTYWAPENSTIRNHTRQPGIWIAESEDGSRKYYFGDPMSCVRVSTLCWPNSRCPTGGTNKRDMALGLFDMRSHFRPGLDEDERLLRSGNEND